MTAEKRLIKVKLSVRLEAWRLSRCFFGGGPGDQATKVLVIDGQAGAFSSF